MRLIDADALREKCSAWNGHGWQHSMCLEKDIKQAPTIDAVPVVRCKDCKYWKPRHVEKDGKEYGYDEMPKEALVDPFGLQFVSQEYGTNIGPKCMRDCDLGYIDDKSVFRSEDDYCSCGVQKEVRT